MTQAQEALLEIARSYVGLERLPGYADSPKIVEMFAAIGHPEIKSDEQAWPAAFVAFCLLKAGFEIPPADINLLGKSYRTYGFQSDPQPGCIGVWPREEKDWLCFVGIIEEVRDDGSASVIGGFPKDRVQRKDLPLDKAIAFRLPEKSNVTPINEVRTQPPNPRGPRERKLLGDERLEAILREFTSDEELPAEVHDGTDFSLAFRDLFKSSGRHV